MPDIEFTPSDIQQLSDAITDMAILWDVPMPPKRLEQYMKTLTTQNTSMSFARLMRSITLARMQDHAFPMPADILQREVRGI